MSASSEVSSVLRFVLDLRPVEHQAWKNEADRGHRAELDSVHGKAVEQAGSCFQLLEVLAGASSWGFQVPLSAP